MKKAILLFAILAILLASSHAQEQVSVLYFHNTGCPICAQIQPSADAIKAEYSGKVQWLDYNWSNEADKQKFYDYNVQYFPTAVVTNGKDTTTFVRYDIETKLKPAIESYLSNSTATSSTTTPFTIAGVFLGGLAAGINPCLFAVLIFLGAFILAKTNSRKAVLKTTIPFIAGVLVAYLALGFTISEILIKYGWEKPANILFAAILALIGLLYILRHRKENSRIFATPEFVKKLLRDSGGKASIPISFGLGVLFASVKAPCGIMYLTIFEKLAQNPIHGLGLLAAFNIGLILPLVIISASFWLGYGNQKMVEFRQKHKYTIRLISGILMLLTAGLILVL